MERNAYYRCAKCGYAYADYAVRVCPHPAVRRVYGGGETTRICVHDCGKCRHAERSANCGALRCTYAET